MPRSRHRLESGDSKPSETALAPTSETTLDSPEDQHLAGLDFRSLWKNASWTSILLIVSTVLAFAETIVLARFLGVAALGLFVLIRAYPEAVQQVLDCRTHETMVRYLGESVALGQRERAGTIVRLIWLVDAATGLLAMALVVATASVAARYLVHDPTMTSLVALYAASQFVGTLDSAGGTVLRVLDRFGLSALMGIGKAAARFIGILAVLLLGGRITGLIYLLVGLELLYAATSACVAYALLRKVVGFRLLGTLGALGERRKEMFRFLLHTNIAGTLKMTSEKVALVLVGALGGPAVAAQYKVASQAGSSLMLFSDPFYQVVYPSLAKMAARKQWSAIFADLRRLRRTTLAVTVPLACAISGLLVLLVPLLFGSEFSPAVIPAVVILWAVVPNVVFFWRRPVLLSLGQAGRLSWYRATAVALQLTLVSLLVRPIGALGAAASLLAMQWLYAAMEIRLIGRLRQRLLDEGSLERPCRSR